MTYLGMKYFKTFFSVLFSMVICSSGVWADSPLTLSGFDTNCIRNNLFNAMTETQEALLTGDCIVFIGFLLWIAYIVFCMPTNTFKKL